MSKNIQVPNKNNNELTTGYINLSAAYPTYIENKGLTT